MAKDLTHLLVMYESGMAKVPTNAIKSSLTREDVDNLVYDSSSKIYVDEPKHEGFYFMIISKAVFTFEERIFIIATVRREKV